jgi:hypothetical protein
MYEAALLYPQECEEDDVDVGMLFLQRPGFFKKVVVTLAGAS